MNSAAVPDEFLNGRQVQGLELIPTPLQWREHRERSMARTTLYTLEVCQTIPGGRPETMALQIPAWMDSPAEGLVPASPIRSRDQGLPFNALSWQNFERLILRLVRREGQILDCIMYGTAGQSQDGIDILAAPTGEPMRARTPTHQKPLTAAYRSGPPLRHLEFETGALSRQDKEPETSRINLATSIRTSFDEPIDLRNTISGAKNSQHFHAPFSMMEIA